MVIAPISPLKPIKKMKNKLKAIWRILRAKSYFYTVHIGDRFVSGHEIGNQPKTPIPAHVRVDIMFAEVDELAIVARDNIKRMVARYHHPRFVDEEPWESNSCPDCKNWGTMDCPNIGRCLAQPLRPYFIPKNEKK